MKEINITTSFTAFNSIDDLSVDVKMLMNEAVKAREKAYAPYSKFKVGAAILLENGVIVTGSNQENAAYPSGLCAERVAVFSAGANYPNVKIKVLAITAGSELSITSSPIPPCGSCRQSLAEYEFKQEMAFEIYFMGETGNVYKSASVANILPLSFDKKFL